jgi:hypothetical protein
MKILCKEIMGQVQAKLARWSASEIGARVYKSLLVIYANFSYIIFNDGGIINP